MNEKTRETTADREILSFNWYISPNGEIHESTPGESRIANRIAGLIPLDFGGMIVMSTDVNATGGNSLKSKLKSLTKTWFNRFMRSRKTDETMRELIKERGIDTGWSIGNLFKGRYFSPKSGQTFNEKSFAIDILGVPFDFVKDVAKVIRKKFDQESVLVINHKDNRPYLLS